MYTVGIVGCGVIGGRLAEAITDHDRFELTACCDLDAERAESFGTDYDCTPYTDHESLVAAEPSDVVYVGVPPAAHRSVAETALDAGANVLCEKPIAPDAVTGRELVDAAESASGTTAINLPFRYTPGVRELLAAIEDGRIGTPRRIELRFRFPDWPREWQSVDWLETREQGGPLREVGTHFLFGVQELFGPIDRVTADVEYVGPDRYETSVVGTFEADGIPGTIDLLTDHDEPEENVLTVVGTDGRLSLTEWYRLIADRNTPDERVLIDDRPDTVSLLLDEFAAELDGDGGDLVSFSEANEVQRVVDAIFGSEGYPVEL